MKFEIKNWLTGKVICSIKGENWKLAFMASAKAGQSFDYADLSGKDFGGVEIKNSSFYNSSFYNSRFYNSSFYNSRFDNSSFYNSSFDNSSFYNSSFYNSSFYNSRFDNSRFDNSSFYNSRFDNSSFYNSSFDKEIIAGERPFFFIGPIGSAQRQLLAISTKAGIRIRTGCFSGSLTEFKAAVKKKHGSTIHGKEYAAAVKLIQAHFKLWAAK